MIALADAPEFAVKFRAGRGVSLGRIIKAIKVTQVARLFVGHDACLPLPAPLMPHYALYAGNALAVWSAVLQVLRFGRNAQICAPIVQAVAVDMINFKPIRGVHQNPMHPQSGDASRSVNAIQRTASFVTAFLGDPMVSSDKGHIHRINNGGVSLGQGYKGVIAFNADFAYLLGHVATSLAALGRMSASNTPGLFFMPRSKALNKEYKKWL
jgi:hypothetical protein